MRVSRIARPAAQVGWMALPLASLLVFVAVQVRHVAPMTTISNVDYFPMVDRALALSWLSLDKWVSWQHPVGYVWLIRLGLELGGDAVRIGQALSILGGVLGLCGTYVLALSVFKDRRLAGLSQAYVASTGVFLQFASIEGTDMLAAGLQIVSVGMLAVSLARPGGPRLGRVFAAGLLAGLAYLVRYNGMLTALVGGLCLAAAGLAEKRSPWREVGLYGLAFLLGSALQWIPSLLKTGNPFYIDQGQNVWFHMYGKTDFITEWGQAPPGITVRQVFAMDPGLFVQHWWDCFQRFWIDPSLAMLNAPLTLFGQAGFIFMLVYPGKLSLKTRGLLGLFVVAHLAALSMMRLDLRFLIIMVPILATAAIYLLVIMLPPRWNTRHFSVSLDSVVLLAGLILAMYKPLNFALKVPEPNWISIQASNALHAAGMQSAHQVLSTHLVLHDASAPAHQRFVQAYWAAPGLTSIAELQQAMRSNGWRFFVYHRDWGPIIYPALRDELSTLRCPAGFVPLHFEEGRSLVICGLVDSLADCTPVGAQLEAGLHLDCYTAYLSSDAPPGAGQRLGVYLHWRTDVDLDVSFKVFVHMLDASGQLVAQNDGFPLGWTYPTQDWQPGERVVDFHQLPIGTDIPAGTYTIQVGLYDETTGTRLKQVDDVGQPGDDRIVLTEITLR